jgi:hypothetical protein
MVQEKAGEADLGRFGCVEMVRIGCAANIYKHQLGGKKMQTKQKRTRVVVSVLALAGLAVFVAFAYAGNLEPSGPPDSTMKTLDEVEPRIPIPASDSPTSTLIISQSGSYYLTGNRLCSGNGIRIDVNDVTIDLCGFTLGGPDGSADGITIYGDRSNVQIRNGTIRDFRYAVFANSGKSHRIDNIRAISNIVCGIYLSADNCAVTGCTIADNGDSASSVVGIRTRANGIIAGNTVINNGTSATGDVYGIYASYKGNVVTGNAVRHNGDAATGDVFGISAGEASTLTGNTAAGNGNSASGDYVMGIFASNGGTLTNNTAHDNGDSSSSIYVYGIYGGGGTVLNGNTSFGNGTSATGEVYGIYAHKGSTLKNNTAYQNAYQTVGRKTTGDVYGIYGDNGTTVIGNTAHLNGCDCNDIDIYGLYVDYDSTVVANNASNNGISTTDCNVVGLNVWMNCLVDQNAASGNGGTNMSTHGTCTLGTNHATP